MKYYYIYSPGYSWWHHRIQRVLEGHFEAIGLLIDPVINTSSNGHMFANGNVTIKIDHVINCIKENMNEFIIFADANCLIIEGNVEDLKSFIESYIQKDLDIVFTDNQYGTVYNIGFMLIKCTQKTLGFFEEVKNKIDRKEYGGWDQEIINKMLFAERNSFFIEHMAFDKKRVWASYPKDFQKIYPEELDYPYVVKMWGKHYKNEKKNFIERIVSYKKIGLL